MSSIPHHKDAQKPNGQLGYINLTVRDQDGKGTLFRIQKSTKVKKLMDAYCEMQSIEINSVSFLFDRLRLNGGQTPFEVGMEDGDIIDAMLHQSGGGLF